MLHSVSMQARLCVACTGHIPEFFKILLLLVCMSENDAAMQGRNIKIQTDFNARKIVAALEVKLGRRQ